MSHSIFMMDYRIFIALVVVCVSVFLLFRCIRFVFGESSRFLLVRFIFYLFRAVVAVDCNFNYIGKYFTVFEFERCFSFTRSFSVSAVFFISFFALSLCFSISDECLFSFFSVDRSLVCISSLQYRNADSRHHLIYFASTLKTTFNFFSLLSSYTTLIST